MTIRFSSRARKTAGLLAIASVGTLSCVASAHAQGTSRPWPGSDIGWQQCQRLSDDKDARLACFDRWARDQQAPAAPGAPAATPTPPALATSPAATSPAASAANQPPTADAATADTRVVVEVSNDNCRDREYSTLSRFWELEPATNCGTFGLRGYRPIDVMLAMATEPPPTPTSPAPNHTGTPKDYQPGEARINLSLRTKLAQGMLTGDDPTRKDSLWFAYSQQSAWQIFNAELSRPFRNTDHEPEVMYVYPTSVNLPGDWRWRYAGIGLVHQSNGQSEPLSRSWNRVYLMGGVELDKRFVFNARAWKRISENPAEDDNPDIIDYIGRVELSGWWFPDKRNSFGLTWRTWGKGSQRLEYTRAIGNPDKSDLRFVAQVFHGYGDTLLDYNQKRTVFSIGLRLIDF